jgi:aminotransferase
MQPDPHSQLVLVFEPFYENYGADAVLSGARPVHVPLDPPTPQRPSFGLDVDRVRAAITPRTRGIVINSPNNPTGMVLTRAELEALRDLCVEHDLVAFTDEIYEHIKYAGEHVPLATIPGMRDRTVAVNALSKTYSVTGWRVGWVIASPELTSGIRKVHDFLTVGAAAPLQQAGVTALQMADDYYATLADEYRERRDVLVAALDDAGFRTFCPDGAYYVMTDIGRLTDDDDVTFCRRIVETPGVAAVPGSSFYSRPELGRSKVRFAFPKTRRTLDAAAERLRRIAPN